MVLRPDIVGILRAGDFPTPVDQWRQTENSLCQSCRHAKLAAGIDLLDNTDCSRRRPVFERYRPTGVVRRRNSGVSARAPQRT